MIGWVDVACTRMIGSLAFGFVVVSTFACGPGLDDAGMSGGASDGSTADSATGPSDSESETGNEQFSCTPEQELVPGYCFERYDIELPGPLVMERAVGADIDGDGADALVLELELDGASMLTLWDFEDEAGAMLMQEVAVESGITYGDFDGTRLLAGRYLPAGEEPSGVESIYRTEIWQIALCNPDPQNGLVSCVHRTANAEFPDPIVLGHTIGCCGGEDLTTTQSLSEAGLELYTASVGRVGKSQYAPPCETLIALAYADVDGSGRGDIVYRSSADCLDEDDPQRYDVGVYLTAPVRPGPVASPDIATALLLAIDLDDDGIDEVLAAETSGPIARYRLLSWAGADAPSFTEATGPERVDRLERGDLRGDGSTDVLYVEERTHIAASPFESAGPLPAELGRLLAVVDANGDGLDDLLMTGSSPNSFLVLLISR